MNGLWDIMCLIINIVLRWYFWIIVLKFDECKFLLILIENSFGKLEFWICWYNINVVMICKLWVLFYIRFVDVVLFIEVFFNF